MSYQSFFFEVYPVPRVFFEVYPVPINLTIVIPVEVYDEHPRKPMYPIHIPLEVISSAPIAFIFA